MNRSKVLDGKIGVIFGVANKHSIAWSVAKAWHEEGATLIFNYQGERLKANVEDLTSSFGKNIEIYPCDVTSDDQITQFFNEIKKRHHKIDLLLHSVAYAPREALEGHFHETSREAFRLALDISAYSFIGITHEALPLMAEGGSILTLSFYGAEKVIPHYNVMGVAKAALEANVRYLAADLGHQKIRVNAISAGPMNTLAARGISDFSEMLKHAADHSPLQRNVKMNELGAIGIFLASDGASAITGQTLYVDCGYSIMGM